MNVADLLKEARRDPQITELAVEASRGAEAYFQAYELIAFGGRARTKRGLRVSAMIYLDNTASPPLNDAQKNAAKLARDVLKRLC